MTLNVAALALADNLRMALGVEQRLLYDFLGIPLPPFTTARAVLLLIGSIVVAMARSLALDILCVPAPEPSIAAILALVVPPVGIHTVATESL